MKLIRNGGARGCFVQSLAAGLLVIGKMAHAAEADVAPLMRYPNTSATSVARGDLWTAPLAGGTASRLIHDPGAVLLPRFSPDGRFRRPGKAPDLRRLDYPQR